MRFPSLHAGRLDEAGHMYCMCVAVCNPFVKCPFHRQPKQSWFSRTNALLSSMGLSAMVGHLATPWVLSSQTGQGGFDSK